MNIEALLVIGTFSLILGLCLYIPARLWIRRKANREANLPTVRGTLTPVGVVFTIAFVIILLMALSVEYWAPSSIVERVPTGGFGQFLVMGAMVGLWFVAEKLLALLGIRLARTRPD